MKFPERLPASDDEFLETLVDRGVIRWVENYPFSRYSVVGKGLKVFRDRYGWSVATERYFVVLRTMNAALEDFWLTLNLDQLAKDGVEADYRFSQTPDC